MRFLIAATAACVAAILFPVSARSSSVLAFDRSGNLFFEGRNTGTILKFSPDGTKSTFAAGNADTAINGDIVVDPAGNLFACANFTTILKFAPDGTMTTFATGVGTYWPSALTMDKRGSLFVGARDAIFKLAPDGTKTVFATGVEPYGLAFDESGNLFAADAHGENGRLVSAVVKFSPDGHKTIFAPNLQGGALAFDRSGNLFVAATDAILKFAPDGTKSTFATNIDGSEGLAFDEAGDLFVCSGNNKILKFAPDGTKIAFSKAGREPGVDEEQIEDSSAGLPNKYAKNYLLAASTISSDKKFAVIYPTDEYYQSAGDAKDYLVRLRPFSILRALPAEEPYFQNQSNGNISAKWSNDSSVALITLEGKWGPRDVFVLEFHNGKPARMTNVLRKVRDLLPPDYHKAIFLEETTFQLDGTNRVVIDAEINTSPNDLGLSPDTWHGHVKATWDIKQAKFVAKEVSGHRRGADAYRNRGQSAAEEKQSSSTEDLQSAIGLRSKDWEYYLSLAWYHLISQQPHEAITAALKALELSPRNAAMIKVTLAHGYLFDNQFDKAKAMYLENKSTKLRDDDRRFSEVVLDDFKELEEAGVTHPDMEKIKALLISETDTR